MSWCKKGMLSVKAALTNSRSGKWKGRTVWVEKELVFEAEHQTNVTQFHAVVKRQTSKWSAQDLK